MEQKKRLNINLRAEDHKEIKARATARGISITTWVLRAIMEQIRKEKQYE